ncbi:hypothetical protein SEA_LUMOS_131 [Mycobacterium phage Lumos]|uniref:Uncharacterized protein n=1 Tax=Mycobacterium phage Lumos TaxID=1701852 RepID=A0A0K2CM80_9CAUD|nr:hypothetical protein J4T93_gp057 [Mycobacterium phage Lumos]ALA06637.1 hypothetical protein SEA_LUMOS_131 [Mycobacterium phage Lumos]
MRVPTALLGAPNACLRAWLLGAVLLGRAGRCQVTNQAAPATWAALLGAKGT